MRVIHFTHGATDPLEGCVNGARFLPLADGYGDTHLSCLHMEEGATVKAPSVTHAAAVLVVHGCMTVTAQARIDIYAGMGCVFDKDESYSFTSEPGAIVLIVESDELEPHARGISSPDRIAGQTWPSDELIRTNS